MTVQPAASDEFRHWFGDSKVVDERGKPLMVYHGTADEFDVFVPSIYGNIVGGIFFTSDRDTAQQFATSAEESTDGNGRVVEAYLSIRNPKVIEATEFMEGDIHTFAREFAAVAAARESGHDGMLIRNVPEHGGRVADQWVAFAPEQIKSAKANVGAFNPDDPRICFKRGYTAPLEQDEDEDESLSLRF